MSERPQSNGATAGPPRTPELHALGPAQLDQLADMVLELATQLHVERARLRVLEHQLCVRGLLDPGEVGAGAPPELSEQLRHDLDHALEGLFGPPTERDDARAPLREPSGGQAPTDRAEAGK